MITNERQFRISNAQLDKMREAAADFDVVEATDRTGSPMLAQAELAGLRSQIEELTEQVREYEALKSGATRVLHAQSLSELPRILIKARIAQRLSQRELAEQLGLKEQQIQRYESEDYSSASLKRLSEIAKTLNLNICEVAEITATSPAQEKAKSKAENLDWNRFPIKHMYKRNWFQGYTGTLAGALADAELLVGQCLKVAGNQPRVGLHRKRVRSGSIVDPYALLAWQCRVLTLAKLSHASRTFHPEKIDDVWLRKLVQLSRFPDGHLRAREFLQDVGITLVIEPHLPSTHLDGAALLGDEGPVVGLTLRYDRLDNFWFVLLHEIIHVQKHLRKGELENIFDDLEAEPDALEREADELAGKALIPDDAWETCLARYLRTEDSVRALAKELKISEAIIAGRIRKEADNYVILNALIGAGQVRRCFPEVRFGQ